MIFKNRSDFMPNVDVEGTLEKDFINSKWALFEIKRDITYYSIGEADIQRPDLLSWKIYGSMNYWWILLKYNNIGDVWNDLYVSQVIKVPNEQDIIDFIAKV